MNYNDKFSNKKTVIFSINGKATIKSLVQNSENFPREIAKIKMLCVGILAFMHDASGLVANLPEKKPNDYAYALRIKISLKKLNVNIKLWNRPVIVKGGKENSLLEKNSIIRGMKIKGSCP